MITPLGWTQRPTRVSCEMHVRSYVRPLLNFEFYGGRTLESFSTRSDKPDRNTRDEQRKGRHRTALCSASGCGE